MIAGTSVAEPGPIPRVGYKPVDAYLQLAWHAAQPPGDWERHRNEREERDQCASCRHSGDGAFIDSRRSHDRGPKPDVSERRCPGRQPRGNGERIRYRAFGHGGAHSQFSPRRRPRGEREDGDVREGRRFVEVRCCEVRDFDSDGEGNGGRQAGRLRDGPAEAG